MAVAVIVQVASEPKNCSEDGRGQCRLGIAALIDKATSYQEVREMQPWIIFVSLGVIAATAAVNEFVFAGVIFSSTSFAWAAALVLLATLFATTVIKSYRGRAWSALRDAAIWVLIAVAVTAGVWIFR